MARRRGTYGAASVVPTAAEFVGTFSLGHLFLEHYVRRSEEPDSLPAGWNAQAIDRRVGP